MTPKSVLTQSLGPAILATAATTLAVGFLGKAEGGTFSSGLNAISHILWGDEATTDDDLSSKYTLTGAALNSAAIYGWAAIHELAVDQTKVPKRMVPMLMTGALVSAAAYLTDYFVVPKRLTPGFEKRLSPQSMFVVYALLATSIAIGTLMSRPKV